MLLTSFVSARAAHDARRGVTRNEAFAAFVAGPGRLLFAQGFFFLSVLTALLTAVNCRYCTTVVAQCSPPVQCGNSTKVFNYDQYYDFDAAGFAHMNWKMWDSDGTNADLFYANNTSGAWVGSKLVTGIDCRLVITPDQVIYFFY